MVHPDRWGRSLATLRPAERQLATVSTIAVTLRLVTWLGNPVCRVDRDGERERIRLAGHLLSALRHALVLETSLWKFGIRSGGSLGNGIRMIRRGQVHNCFLILETGFVSRKLFIAFETEAHLFGTEPIAKARF